ncbi:glycoside hydrolase family 97 protein [Luteolibacter arcticus]|uniref:Glycoside hydrolase family 97 protein n=1 Tax=Luteolibacter arcticus TaxID=1581411 RepID=A0ABT3GK58_9BACT|nr:glycoside hydrolase family 97 protein [Luteolibacter arcticus]MCW1923904.1 glycoside hydrolase family 97 protein [Luteolibacter arcticus]
MNILNPTALLALPLIAAAPASAALVIERTLASPGGALVFTLERDDTSQALSHSVTYSGRPVVTHGALGIQIDKADIVGDEGTIERVVEKSSSTEWTNPFGERSTVPDNYREETLTISHAGQGSFGVKLQVRAYDEGVALRYLIEGSGTVMAEKTSFPLPETTQVWVSGSTQAPISKAPIAKMSSSVGPVLAELSPDLFAAFGEAALADASVTKFTRSETSTINASIGGRMEFQGSFTSAWRYVRVAQSPGAMLEGNHFMLNLCEPSQVADTSWIRPGKVLRDITLTTEGGRACVDFAAAHKLEYVLFDAGWYGKETSRASDASKSGPDPERSPGPLDVESVIAYGKTKGVGVILYVNQVALTPQLDKIAPLYQSWGVAGIKFGYVTAGSQAATRWLNQAVKKCADHHLLVDIHDDFRPTGMSRTYPNLMTQEGIRGDEESPSNATVLNSVFVRGLAGPADQTNCYFAPRVTKMGSHASQLAKSVCIFSPWQFLFWYDRPAASPPLPGAKGFNPANLEEVPELTFFERLPTTWDETRVLDGYPGSHATIARRKGKVWFLAGLNGATARTFDVPLEFLDPATSYKAEIFVDDPAVTTTTKVRIDTQPADHTTQLKLSVAPSNGFAVILTP